MKKLRLSYSLLSTWQKGRPDDCVKMYFHMEMPSNKAMNAGRDIHEDIRQHVATTGKFPDWLWSGVPQSPQPEKEIIVPYNEQFDLKVIIDCLDTQTGYEWKTGTSDALTWARTAQIPLYMLACELAGIPVEKFYLVRWNQYEKKKDWSMLWNTPDKIETARNFVDSIAPEIHEYFSSNGLI